VNVLPRTLLAAVGTGAAGWALENTFFPKRSPQDPNGEYRFSQTLGEVPVLPVYAAGGALVSLLEPHLRGMHPVGRALTYAGALGLLEAGVGYAEKISHPDRPSSWDYQGRVVNLPHVLGWGVLALGVEYVVRKL